MTQFMLVRHGHTAGNARSGDAPLSGWTDHALSDLGHEQARCLGSWLARQAGQAPIYASSSRRALDTARLAIPARAGAIVVWDDLREIGCGQVDGLPVSRVKEAHPDLWARNERQDDEDFRWPGGESYREFRARCLGAMDTISRTHPHGLVLVFTHAGFISQVVGALAGTSAAAWGRFRPQNCSVTDVLWFEGRGDLRSFDVGVADHCQ
jgi:broad specificity phosphatase PhoE